MIKRNKMKKLLIFGFLLTFLMTAFTVDVDAQYRRKKKKKKKKKPTTERNSEYFDESGGDITDRLWYGADVTLNFGSFNGTSGFVWGLSPMVGYKITDDFSAGPKISFLNNIQKSNNGGGQDLTLNTINYGGGIWTRHKIFQNYFVHGEFEFINEEFGLVSGGRFLTDPQTNKVQTIRETNAHYYLGGGYGGSGGQGFGFTATILWDFSQEFTSQSIPIVYRLGITYNF